MKKPEWLTRLSTPVRDQITVTSPIRRQRGYFTGAGNPQQPVIRDDIEYHRRNMSYRADSKSEWWPRMVERKLGMELPRPEPSCPRSFSGGGTVRRYDWVVL